MGMEASIRKRLSEITEESSAELTKLMTAYDAMSGEAKISPFYKSLGEKIASIEAALNTLVITSESI